MGSEDARGTAASELVGKVGCAGVEGVGISAWGGGIGEWGGGAGVSDDCSGLAVSGGSDGAGAGSV